MKQENQITKFEMRLEPNGNSTKRAIQKAISKTAVAITKTIKRTANLNHSNRLSLENLGGSGPIQVATSTRLGLLGVGVVITIPSSHSLCIHDQADVYRIKRFINVCPLPNKTSQSEVGFY